VKFTPLALDGVIRVELDVFRDCANGIVRSIPDPSASRVNKSTASELEGTPTTAAEDPEK
jgi:hypothetical protein